VTEHRAIGASTRIFDAMARCEPGWGEFVSNNHPTPLASFATLPLQGTVFESVASDRVNYLPFSQSA